jgi:hypothetical protein
MSAETEPADATERQPWDQQPGEPDRWYARFADYLREGARRSVLGVYRKERRARACLGALPLHSVPHRWRVAKECWHWDDRAAAWDRAERARSIAEYEADRQATRAERLRVLRAANAKLETAIANLDPTAASWAEVTAALKMTCEQLRAEQTDATSGKSSDNYADLLNPESARAELVALLDAAGAFRRENEPPNPTGA